jgi:hypothetical protein
MDFQKPATSDTTAANDYESIAENVDWDVTSQTTTQDMAVLPDVPMEMMDWGEEAPVSPSTTTDTPFLTGRPPKLLYLSCNPDHLNDYQCLIRQNMEFFEATADDLSAKVRGRNKPIVLGQVGLRCIHCKPQPSLFGTASAAQSQQQQQPQKGSVYYPQGLAGIYQAAQTLATTHWLAEQEYCTAIHPFTRQQMQQFKQCSTVEKQHSQGKEYWAKSAVVLGVVEHPEWGLRFQPL